MKKMHLYIWHDALRDYLPGVMVAVAPDVEAARRQLRDRLCRCCYNELDAEPEDVALTKPYTMVLYGGS